MAVAAAAAAGSSRDGAGSSRDDIVRLVKQATHIHQFTLGTKLGEGAFGVVFRARFDRDRDNLLPLCVKRFIKPVTQTALRVQEARSAKHAESKREMFQVQAERHAVDHALVHGNIVVFFAAVTDDDERAGDAKALVFELCDGTLGDFIKKPFPPFQVRAQRCARCPPMRLTQENQLLRMAMQLANGLRVLHEGKEAALVHRDIYLENCFYIGEDPNTVVMKLGDMTTCKLSTDELDTYKRGSVHTSTRLREYPAPPFSPADDVWYIDVVCHAQSPCPGRSESCSRSSCCASLFEVLFQGSCQTDHLHLPGI